MLDKILRSRDTVFCEIPFPDQSGLCVGQAGKQMVSYVDCTKHHCETWDIPGLAPPELLSVKKLTNYSERAVLGCKASVLDFLHRHQSMFVFPPGADLCHCNTTFTFDFLFKNAYYGSFDTYGMDLLLSMGKQFAEFLVEFNSRYPTFFQRSLDQARDRNEHMIQVLNATRCEHPLRSDCPRKFVIAGSQHLMDIPAGFQQPEGWNPFHQSVPFVRLFGKAE